MYAYDDKIGTFVSQEQRAMSQALTDYDHDLHLVHIPDGERPEQLEEFPFAVVCRPVGSPGYIVLRVKADQVNMSIFDALSKIDGTKQDTQKNLERDNAAARLYHDRLMQEQQAEVLDKARFILQSPRSRVTVDGRVYGN